MTEKERLRFFIAVWIDNIGESMDEMTTRFEKQLTIGEIVEVGDFIDASRVFHTAQDKRKLGYDYINPYEVDITSWWLYYAGWHSTI